MIVLLHLACSSSYPAGPDALDALISDGSTNVSIESDWIMFEPVFPSSNVGFAFYPGGKVEAEAYAPVFKATQ